LKKKYRLIVLVLRRITVRRRNDVRENWTKEMRGTYSTYGGEYCYIQRSGRDT
jgi:hypothetical protein